MKNYINYRDKPELTATVQTLEILEKPETNTVDLSV